MPLQTQLMSIQLYTRKKRFLLVLQVPAPPSSSVHKYLRQYKSICGTYCLSTKVSAAASPYYCISLRLPLPVSQYQRIRGGARDCKGGVT